MQFSHELNVARTLAKQCGLTALKLRNNLHVERKPHGEGPVTNADRQIDDTICNTLQKEFPHDDIISEESYQGQCVTHPRTWLVDPIDGTSSYIAGRDDFVIMIGLAINGESRLGVVYQPSHDRLWYGIAGTAHHAGAAFRVIGDCKTELCARKKNLPHSQFILAASRHHRSTRQSELIHRLHPKKVLYRGSVGIKSMLIVEDEADLYVAWSKKIKLWDTCAPAAIVTASGAHFSGIDGSTLKFWGQITHGKAILVANFHADRSFQDQLQTIDQRKL